MKFFSIIFSVCMHHVYHSSFGNWIKKAIENKYDNNSCYYPYKWRLAWKVFDISSYIICLFKSHYKGKSYLIYQDKQEPNHSKGRRKKIELFKRMKLTHKSPGIINNFFFHYFLSREIFCQNHVKNPENDLSPLSWYSSFLLTVSTTDASEEISPMIFGIWKPFTSPWT